MTGCGADGASSSSEGEEKTPTAEEVLSQSYEANEELNSFDMRMTTNTNIMTDGLEQTTESNFSGSIVQDPFEFKLKMEVIGEEMETYLKDDMIYMYEPTTEMWLKMDSESQSAIPDTSEATQNPTDKLKEIQELSDSMEVTETDTAYVLDVAIAEDKMMEVMEQELGTSMAEVRGVEDLTFDYTITINKKTNYMTNTTFDIAGSMTEAGTETQFDGVLNMDMSNFNGFETIELPPEAETAMDLSAETAPAERETTITY
ncbi:hypothetical protein SAMN05421503_1098 [Terribacillus aidingensis]|uniref:Uncharacterized protein n=1 Tax=Terribacillus aidingensis TaxID=586416 RepID=A0A285NAR3_9BACI|nr:DUF6612 family protein [Terribacillus aidingensis]SNZ06003.1 hypothetical protein SAMN05421503_1098 [Terribacillus aidingensis]